MIWILLALYFLPAIVASARGHHNSGSIFVLNLFLGWTLIGWVIALAMACSQVRRIERTTQPIILRQVEPLPPKRHKRRPRWIENLAGPSLRSAFAIVPS